MKNNANYKDFTDFYRRMRTFNVGDYMMISLRPERFPPGTVKKLHVRSAWTFQIRKKINSIVYVVDLPPDFCSSCTFNVDDLIPYRGTLNTPFNSFMDEPTHELSSKSPSSPPFPLKLFHAVENIDSILIDQVISNRDGGTRRYLVKLRETWIRKFLDYWGWSPTAWPWPAWALSQADSSFPTRCEQERDFHIPREMMRTSRADFFWF